MKKILFLLVLLTACTSGGQVTVNQLGYYPGQEKTAVVDAPYTGSFLIVDHQSGATVFKGIAGEISPSPFSGKVRTRLDFTSLESPGIYHIVTEQGMESPAFRIGDSILAPLASAALEAFFLQRSTPGHPDTVVLVHASAASPDRPEGTIIPSSGGWYDAGDYNKYTVNASYTTGLILAGYEKYPRYAQNRQLLDQVMYNLQWSLTMQDPADGGVYHKLTTPEFEAFIKPGECKKPRYVVQKSITATLDFAASMAQAARIYKNIEDYAATAMVMEQAAEAAFSWALEHPEALYNQFLMNEQFSPAIHTGAYGDFSAGDEFFWASCELYLTTGKEIYLKKAMEYAPEKFSAPTWGNVSGLGIFALLTHNKATGLMKEQLVAFCDSVVSLAGGAPFASSYGNSARDFYWGCLSESCCGNAISLLYGFSQTENRDYLIQAYHNMDYLLGRNPLGYCYVTGMGTKSPQNPHHRLAHTDDIPGPLPGFLVGGPNPAKQDGCVYPSDLPDECYLDVLESYASNEIAINWNATLLHLAVALQELSPLL
ncbi:MAG: glycoside hydrolase family 9 protein [Bacteroidales bacterium]|nr:glycoside hydrolase family 9 protein [Bacteroidales bacterium]MDD4031223.1 glycoside hydrolase family 9 protein [Bacteroidales bacterium]MDD4435767.1 glycoside hydrolase family 9 protein [Bacteroidales bacterium]MDD5733219.1 glycoside hydrolase family 9 protein [Bacteroidales bacterium]